jgi:hypothetical protein
VLRVEPVQPSLEDVFVTLTTKQGSDPRSTGR